MKIHSRTLRTLLLFMVMLGIALTVIGPTMRVRNEGFGDAPGLSGVSRYWQRMSQILIPVGAGTSIAAGFVLFAIDRNRSKR